MNISCSESAPAESQELLSQLSIGMQLPVINDALNLLSKSPIPKKRINHAVWVNAKVETVCSNLKKSLCVPGPESLIGSDTRDLRDIISRIKEKLHHEGISRAEKIQLMTVLPLHWSTKKVCRVMDVTRRMAIKAKEISISHRIVSTPLAKPSKKNNIFLYNRESSLDMRLWRV